DLRAAEALRDRRPPGAAHPRARLDLHRSRCRLLRPGPPDRGLPCDRRLHAGPAAGGTARGRSVVARTWRRGGPPATRARRRDCPVEPRTVVPNSLPMPAVSAIASVPQKVMRNVALSPLAP